MSGEALAHEIRREHERLAALVQRLREDVTALWSSWASARDDRRTLLNHLRRHFAVEEDGGFIEDVRPRWPHATPHVEMLRAEHERPRAARRLRSRVFLLTERCKGCRFCVEFCPRQVLAMSDRFNSKGYHIPVVIAEERCTDCKMCELLCPEFAIYVVRLQEEGR